MFGVDWPVWVGGGLVAAWRIVRWLWPAWADRVRWLEATATEIYHQVELLAPLATIVGLGDELDKHGEARRRLVAAATAAGIPLGTRELELAESTWRRLAADRAAQALEAINAEAAKLMATLGIEEEDEP